MSADEDEAYVEVEEEDPYQPVTSKLPNPEIEYWKYVLWAYFTNPWLILGFVLFLYFYVYKRLRPRIEEWWDDRRAHMAEARYVADVKKNPDIYRAKMEAVEAARRRQQQKYEADAALAEEKRKAKEEEERRRRLEDLENLVSGRGYRNKSELRGQNSNEAPTPQKPKTTTGGPSLRPEYNPLMGDSGGSSRNFRRRDLQSGGG